MIGRTLNHYRILEKIGAGGMGEVYRAEDVSLKRQVALKVLPAEMADSPDRLARFRREAEVLASIDHPNIVTIFSVEEDEGIQFLTMQLVEGQPLSELIPSGGMSLDRIFEIAIPLADALAAAHDKGIIHRDLKPGNIMVTDTGRVEVLDFGLAKLRQTTAAGVETELPTQTMTQEGVVMGTVPYMSPEQIEAKEIDQRSDIFSLGIILFEMATGSRPFSGDTTPSLMSSILKDVPSTVDNVRVELPHHFGRTVRRCLEKEPSRRYQSALDVRNEFEDLKEDLKSESREVRRPEPPVDRPSFSKPLLITAAVGLVLSAVAVVYFATRGGDTGEQAPPQTMQAEEAPVVRTRPSIAILAVQGLSPDPSDSWLSTALAEMLATEIGIGESLRVIPRETVARVSQEISLADPDAPAGPAAQQLRKMLNSEFVVSGSYVLSGDKPDRQIRLDLQIQDTASGETVGLVSERQPEGQLFVLVERLGSALREKLEVDEAVEAAEALGKPAFPSTSEAVRHYSQGLEKLQIYDAAAAVDLLTRATKSDPQFPGAHSALAAAWGKLGFDEKAAAEAELAFHLSEGFAREDRLAAEAIFRELGGDWQKATEIYQALFGFFPDDLDYGLSLAAAQTAADRADDALATVASLRKLPGPTAADPRIDLAEADAHSKLTDFSSMAAAASTAAEKAYAIGAQLLFAQARLAEGDALVRLGEFDEGRQRLAKAGEIYADAGDRAHQAYVENATAISFAYEGDLETARDGFQNALEISREIGDRGGISNHLNNLANMRASLGDPAGARENYYEVLDIARKMGHKTNTALALNNIGTTFFEEGIFDRAIGAYEEALDLFRETGASLHVAICLSNIAEVLHGQGSLVLAEENYRQALEVVRGLGDPWEVAEVQFHLAQVLNDQGDSNGAVELLKDSQQGYSLAGDPEGEANATRKAAEIEAETVNEQ